MNGMPLAAKKPKSQSSAMRLPNETWDLIREFSKDFGGTTAPTTVTLAFRVLKHLKDSGHLEDLKLSLLSTFPPNRNR